MPPLPVFLDPHGEIEKSQNTLPHWEQDGRTYFVTFRLADSIPRTKLDEWEQQRAAWLRAHPQPWSPEVEREYVRRFANQIERWLDEGHGACVLRDEAARGIVAVALMHFEPTRHRQLAWVVMPNHVHALFSVGEGHGLAKILQSWKGFTAREINRVSGGIGPLWQRDYFDRMIRNDEHFWNVARYIRNNPVKSHLVAHEYTLYESEYVREALGEAAFQPPRKQT